MLSPRSDFLVPPQPYSSSDVYPWRFNRGLSYIRRPLLKVEHTSGDELIWGNRHLYHSHGYLFDLIVTSRIFAQSAKMRELIGKFNRERGDTFNDDVAKVRPVVLAADLVLANDKRARRYIEAYRQRQKQ